LSWLIVALRKIMATPLLDSASCASGDPSAYSSFLLLHLDDPAHSPTSVVPDEQVLELVVHEQQLDQRLPRRVIAALDVLGLGRVGLVSQHPDRQEHPHRLDDHDGTHHADQLDRGFFWPRPRGLLLGFNLCVGQRRSPRAPTGEQPLIGQTRP